MRKFTCQSDKTLSCLCLESGVCLSQHAVNGLYHATLSHTTSMKNVLLQLTQWGPLLSLLRIFLQNSGQDCHVCVWYILTVHIITRELEPCLVSGELWALGRSGQNLHWVAGRGGGCSQMMDGPFLQVTSGDRREHPCNAQCVHCWRVFYSEHTN